MFKKNCKIFSSKDTMFKIICKTFLAPNTLQNSNETTFHKSHLQKLPTTRKTKIFSFKDFPFRSYYLIETSQFYSVMVIEASRLIIYRATTKKFSPRAVTEIIYDHQKGRKNKLLYWKILHARRKTANIV